MIDTNVPNNPVATLETKDDKAKAGAFVGNLEADYKVHGFEDLRLHANFGADYSYGIQNTSINRNSSSNNYYGWDGYTQKTKYNLQFNATAQYYKDFNENKIGISVPNTDYDASVKAIRYLFENPDECKAMGLRAYEYGKKAYASTPHLMHYLEVYKSIAKK